MKKLLVLYFIMSLCLVTSLGTSFVAGELFAEETASENVQVATSREYLGEVDEEKIIVQEALPVPRKQMSKKQIQKSVYKRLFKDKEE